MTRLARGTQQFAKCVGCVRRAWRPSIVGTLRGLKVQDVSPRTLSPEEEIFNSRSSKIWEGMMALKRTAEFNAIISRETTDVWLSRIAEHIPANVKLILVSPHPPTPDELMSLAWSNTTDAGVLSWCSKAREKQESGEKTVYVYIGSASKYPGGLDRRRRYMLSRGAKPHDEQLKRKIKNLGLSSKGKFGTLFKVPFKNNFGGHVLDDRALTILTRLHLMISLGAVDGKLKSKTKHLVPWDLGQIRYIGLATDNPLEIAINKSSGPKKSGERRVQGLKKKSERKRSSERRAQGRFARGRPRKRSGKRGVRGRFKRKSEKNLKSLKLVRGWYFPGGGCIASPPCTCNRYFIGPR
jgi:hypothetical protein